MFYSIKKKKKYLSSLISQALASASEYTQLSTVLVPLLNKHLVKSLSYA